MTAWCKGWVNGVVSLHCRELCGNGASMTKGPWVQVNIRSFSHAQSLRRHYEGENSEAIATAVAMASVSPQARVWIQGETEHILMCHRELRNG